MSSYDKSQYYSTDKIILIWMPVNILYLEFDVGDDFWRN